MASLKTIIAQTPYDVVYVEDRVKLKHYLSPQKTKSCKTPLLVVYSLINRETLLDLQPGNSVVERFLDQGIDLYVVEWGYPEKKDRFLGFDDHINGYLDNMINFILKKNDIKKLNLMGICMGGVFCLIYSALYPEKVKNLVASGTPVDFKTKKELPHLLMDNLDVDSLVDRCGNISGNIINLGFLMVNPARLMIDKYVNFMKRLGEKDFVETFIQVEKWIYDSPALPGEIFRELAKECYRKNNLIKNRLKIANKRVDLKKITMPVLNIYCERDHLVPPQACESLTSNVGSEDTSNICLESGHIGICINVKIQKIFVSAISSWLKKRDKEVSCCQKA